MGLPERWDAPLVAKHPFSARVPLRAVRAVRAGKAYLTLGGSSLAFDLASGEEIRCDLPIRPALAAPLAEAFLEAATREGTLLSAAAGDSIEVTSASPPPRIPFGQAWLMVMALLLPWLMATTGASGGPVAAASTSLVLILALVLMFVRAPFSQRFLGWATAMLGVAFLVDAASTGQALRLAGAVTCVLLAVWMLGGFGTPRSTDRTDG